MGNDHARYSTEAEDYRPRPTTERPRPYNEELVHAAHLENRDDVKAVKYWSSKHHRHGTAEGSAEAATENADADRAVSAADQRGGDVDAKAEAQQTKAKQQRSAAAPPQKEREEGNEEQTAAEQQQFDEERYRSADSQLSPLKEEEKNEKQEQQLRQEDRSTKEQKEEPTSVRPESDDFDRRNEEKDQNREQQPQERSTEEHHRQLQKEEQEAAAIRPQSDELERRNAEKKQKAQEHMEPSEVSTGQTEGESKGGSQFRGGNGGTAKVDDVSGSPEDYLPKDRMRAQAPQRLSSNEATQDENNSINNNKANVASGSRAEEQRLPLRKLTDLQKEDLEKKANAEKKGFQPGKGGPAPESAQNQSERQQWYYGLKDNSGNPVDRK